MENVENANEDKKIRGGFITPYRYFLDYPVDGATKLVYLILFSYRFEAT